MSQIFFHFEEMTQGGYILLLLSQNVNKNKVTTLDPTVRENTVLMHTISIARLSKYSFVMVVFLSSLKTGSKLG